MEVLLFKIKHKCKKCGRIHEEFPDDVKVFDSGDLLAGFYWECSCKSTMFFPMAKGELIRVEQVA